MMELKEYQKRTLKALSDYFMEVNRLGSASAAFMVVTERVYGEGIPYRQVSELPGLPYVCLRIPTGGGKTLVAAHAAGVAAHELVEADHPVVLWLVPSNPIREQTLAALRDPAHPYRRALEERLGACEVVGVEEALGASRARYASGAAVIVATMQSFRVSDTEGRKVYEQNGALMDHFTGLPNEVVAELERGDDGKPVPSLTNVLRLYRPIVIVDEAHNARTDLSFETLARFRPSCILEFTATPATEKNRSNVLHSVSAAELQVEDMIKLPIRLVTRPDWKLLLSDAIAQLNALDEAAKRERIETGEYIRPVMLIQAEARRGTDPVTVDVVRQTLIGDHRIPEAQIAVATGGSSDLDGVDVLAPTCPIRFVITVQQLREGWDCPFAYVLCTLAQTRSTTAVEQILGRVIRLPRTRRKNEEALNQAYAFSASASFSEAAETLVDALVHNGFERLEAKELIEAATPKVDQTDLPLFSGRAQEPATASATVTVPVLPDLSALPPGLAEKIAVNGSDQTVTVRGELTEGERDALAAAMDDPGGKEAAHQLFQRAQEATKQARRQPSSFSVPLLAIKQGELWEPFDETHFLEAEWDLAKCDPELSAEEWAPGRSDAHQGVVTITEKGRAAYFITELHEQLSLVADDRNWSVGALVAWLDRNIPHPDVDPMSAGIFLTNVVRYLMEERDIPLAELVHDKYRLKRAIADKIEEHRRAAYGQEYQAVLFGDDSPVEVTPEVCFTYEHGAYPYQFIYRGARQWQKHFYKVVGDLKSEGEEFECACFLDELPEVETWVRNVSRPPAFWMQTSTDKTYPDFVCKLRDGRILVVEYKGADRWSDDDSKEKRALGELWEARSGGCCLYIMPKGKDFAAIRAKILADSPVTAG
ncbi:DEAD/DEAH box helicase [Thioalkalivibrio sp.]|uniref:DEAD/DEAH box helicase n=1 Tax=Thioalkalivibrio sp. TaxID=2093813 RepID=UPI003567464B